MTNMIQAARNQVAALTQTAYEQAAAAGVLPAGAQVKATVEIPKDTSHGDYASSFAMAGAKALHMAPRAIAQAIVDHLELEGTLFQRAEIAGPGFLNFFYAPRWYGEALGAVEADPEKAKKYASLLYSQALLIAGLPLEDPSGYTDLVCELMK